ncbi:hypothetical protein HYDPIDRAFT_28144 [Hydnomerulius pinastri MD-312]|uniref:Uncharacterized protein n=1 Tax=Hydnomerulius pinastri MD-312 TaxID=994086 RepID=A0A0C9VGS5_9AGAM|nr:hypothetical protein HYDPIDRAFT_28144 [Hydnomerulius pinastri MD-312]
MHRPSGTPAYLNTRLTVHDFLPDTNLVSSSLASRLEQGRALAFVSSSNAQWISPCSNAGSSTFKISSCRLYEYNLQPPLLSSAVGWFDIQSIPEWGAGSVKGDHDYFKLEDLDEFESTDFQILPRNLRIFDRVELEFQARLHGKRASDTELCGDQPAKRPRLDTSPITDLIPQPHFLPGPAAKFDPVDTSRIAPYRKTQLVPVSPYDTLSVTQLMNSGFRRGAWLIPVRGSLPWDGATTAVILESPNGALSASGPYPSGPDNASSCKITWTRESLLDLWTFLKSIQQAKQLGPISLSFHAAPADAVDSTDTASGPTGESNNPYLHLHQSSKPTAGSPDEFSAYIYRARLEGTDYIKVYHDIHYSLSLRNILDAYRYIHNDGSSGARDQSSSSTKQKTGAASDQKIRMLKGACLVFMDERSKAAFLM